jgi:hypothetical protein
MPTTVPQIAVAVTAASRGRFIPTSFIASKRPVRPLFLRQPLFKCIVFRTHREIDGEILGHEWGSCKMRNWNAYCLLSDDKR